MVGKHYRPPGKKKEGNAAKFVTRSQALKLLQISLPLFRKLCILKGVTPREPKKKFKGTHQTYYHVKDIAFLHHEPLLEVHRAIKTHERKIKKAEAKKNIERANRLRDQTPKPKIDRIIRQRYPRFVDALGELDDCLSMVHLFAALPASESKKIDVERVHKCRRLAHEWQAFISRTHKLRKAFVSVKGIYYQAAVEGQAITWLTPHSLQQVVSEEVDLHTMLNFLQLYEPLLGFVNFRLYHSINLKYPPLLDPRLEALAADLYALSRYVGRNTRPSAVNSESVYIVENEHVEVKQSGAQSEDEKSELRLAQLHHQLPSNEHGPGALMHLVEEAAGDEEEEDQDTQECRKLFQNLKFFLSREVPRESLLFVIPAFGGVVSWEGEGGPFGESDQSITHQIVDREAQGHKFLSREYVQPQWIFDCVNARIILPTNDYVVGKIPPPHLSPFVDNEEEGAYVPDYAQTIKHLQAAARKEILPLPGVGKDLDDPQNLLAEGVIDRAEANEAAQRKQKMMLLEQQYHKDLKKELQHATYTPMDSKVDEQVATEVTKTGEESSYDVQNVDDMGKLLMSRKKRKLLEAMQISNDRKQAKHDLIKQRKKKIEATQSQGS
ncbi:PREDICTED: pescadillo homolog isoform X1 [Lupinus angustifolius]|uniref:pescadillo homolog isoform X1 n=1 Tax=Lupinus angustifolius TaxID=3871 RepID=UPI00092F5C3B|nr:PREDICTED: pescadillo homolog isoform X1 [Lupinus angustifolius]XP_019429029.1 PREDICTED: pescadillo homolog isoform X2 [Lupinus angustifolius]XP_019429030.1 PREDICTED: pescadillo homolog isoform X1 [Lupinus angustifolius]